MTSRINGDRAGDTSAEKSSSANSPAILSSVRDDVSQLKSMGIDCGSSLSAEYVLACTTLHRLLAYRRFVEENKRGRKPELKEFWDVLTFDRRIQSTLIKYIGIFESKFRSVYSRLMGQECGEFALYEKRNFRRPDAYDRSRVHYETDINRQKRNRFIKRQLDNYDGKVPLGVAVEYLSLGTLSKFYTNTKSHAVTKECAESFNVNKDKMASWLKTLTDVRNCCAHFNPYVTRRQIPSTPLPMRGEEEMSRHPFYAALMLQHLLYREDVEAMEDVNVHFAKKLEEDIVIHVGQFLRLYAFDERVADALWIPRRYRPKHVVLDTGAEGYEFYETRQVPVPDAMVRRMREAIEEKRS